MKIGFIKEWRAENPNRNSFHKKSVMTKKIVDYFYLVLLALLMSSCHEIRESNCDNLYYKETPLHTEVGVTNSWKKVYDSEFSLTNTDTAIWCASNSIFINDYTKSIEKIDIISGDVEERTTLNLDFIPIQREVKLRFDSKVLFFDNGYNLLVFDSSLNQLMSLIPDSINDLRPDLYYSFTRDYCVRDNKIELSLYMVPVKGDLPDSIFRVYPIK